MLLLLPKDMKIKKLLSIESSFKIYFGKYYFCFAIQSFTISGTITDSTKV